MNQPSILHHGHAATAHVTTPALTPAAEWLDSRLALVRARERLDRELRRIAVDVVGHFEHDELDPAAKLMLRRVTERAIDAALEPMASAFGAALARGIDGLPIDLRDRLTRAEARRDIGWE